MKTDTTAEDQQAELDRQAAIDAALEDCWANELPALGGTRANEPPPWAQPEVDA